MSPRSPRSPRFPKSPRAEGRNRRAGQRVLSVLALVFVLLPLQGTLDRATSAPAQTTTRAAQPKVFLALKKSRVTNKQHARAKVVVAAPGSRVQRKLFGQVKVLVKGGGKTRSVVAGMADHRTVVTLPKLSRGFYKVRAEFLGNQRLGKAHSRFKKLTVIRAGGGGGRPSGFPNAGNTGVPAGVTLKPYTGSCTISSAVTIDAKTINCPAGVSVKAAGVVIENSMVNGNIMVDTDVNRSWSLTLTDSEVSATGDLPAITNGNVSILRADIHGGHNGLECQEHSSHCSLKDSWIHDQWQAPSGDTHLGGLLVLGNQVPCTGANANGVPACAEIVHNTVVCDAPVNSSGGGCTGDINLINHYGPLHGAIIDNNYLGANTGAAYCTYGSAGFEYPADHIVYTDNVFQRGTNNKCADYGPVTNFDATATGNVWSRNHFDDGAAISCSARRCM